MNDPADGISSQRYAGRRIAKHQSPTCRHGHKVEYFWKPVTGIEPISKSKSDPAATPPATVVSCYYSHIEKVLSHETSFIDFG